jgi:hypothetical protein
MGATCTSRCLPLLTTKRNDGGRIYWTIETEGVAGIGLSLAPNGFGTTRYTYFDTEAAIGSIMEIVYLDSGGRDFMAKIKSGDF